MITKESERLAIEALEEERTKLNVEISKEKEYEHKYMLDLMEKDYKNTFWKCISTSSESYIYFYRAEKDELGCHHLLSLRFWFLKANLSLST